MILNDQRNPPVGAIRRICLVSETLIGETADLRDLIGAQAFFLHETARAIGPISREFPVRIAADGANALKVGGSSATVPGMHWS